MMSELREPRGEQPGNRRARLIAGSVLLLLVLALLILAGVRATSPTQTTGTRTSVTRGGVTVSLEIDKPGVLSGSTVTGHVVVLNNSGRDIGTNGVGSCASDAFVVNLDDGVGHHTDVGFAGTCRAGYTFTAGTTTDSVRVPSVGADGRPLPAGRYQAVLTAGPAYPLPVPVPVPVTLRNG